MRAYNSRMIGQKNFLMQTDTFNTTQTTVLVNPYPTNVENRVSS